MNILRVIIMSILMPIWIWIWLFCSLRDFGRFFTHALAAMIYLVWVVWYRLTDPPRSRRLLREAQRELEGTGSALYAFVGRFLRWLGFAGLLDRLERGLLASTRLTVAMETRTAEAAKHYKFQESYRVLGTLPGGGSTAKLFIVEPVQPRSDWPGRRFVLKYFDLRTGSRLDETMRESRSLQSARRIGAVLDYHIDEQAFYYVMPFFEGPTLTACVQSRFAPLEPDQWLPEAEARKLLGWFKSLLVQVSDFHRAGVVHKDVKPDNVVVLGEEVRLIDLGLLTEVTSDFTLTTHGTEYYRDPEMVRLALAGAKVKEVDARRFDIYSAGAVLYFLLEGSFPACGPLSQFSRPVPFALQWMAAQAMADASKRYESTDVMIADLETFLKRSKRGRMDELKPADLPSFHGQPGPVVPERAAHRFPQPKLVVGSLAATTGGGRHHGRPRRRHPLRLAGLAIIILLIFLAFRATKDGRFDGARVVYGPPAPGITVELSPLAAGLPEAHKTLQQALNQPLTKWLEQIRQAYQSIPLYQEVDVDSLPILVTANYLETPGVFDPAATQWVCRFLAVRNQVLSVEGLSLPAGLLADAANANRLSPVLSVELQAAADLDQPPLLLYVTLIEQESTARVRLISRLGPDETEVHWDLATSPYGGSPVAEERH